MYSKLLDLYMCRRYFIHPNLFLHGFKTRPFTNKNKLIFLQEFFVLIRFPKKFACVYKKLCIRQRKYNWGKTAIRSQSAYAHTCVTDLIYWGKCPNFMTTILFILLYSNLSTALRYSIFIYPQLEGS